MYENRHSIMSNHNIIYKIALVGDCLAGGGAEKVHALLSIYFQKAGLKVHNCIFGNQISYDYAGSLLNLGIVNSDSNVIKRKFCRFYKFNKFIKNNNFDVVIDFRMRTNFGLEWAISKFVYPKNTFYTVHSGILEFYFPKNAFLSGLIYKNRNIVAVSKSIQKAVVDNKLAQNSSHIYNPIDCKSIDLLKNKFGVVEEKYILGVGRMNDGVKQFDKLILAYSKSNLPKQNIKLLLLGDGILQIKYIQLAKSLNLEDKIVFKGLVENPFPYYQKSLFMVLCSKNEGFPNVILESLATETPVISFDCFTGPKEIIIDKYNGLLVEDQQWDKLIQAMNLLVNDEKLYQRCKQNAKQSVLQFDIERIGEHWLEFLKKAVR